MVTETDLALIKRAQNGDIEARNQVVLQHQRFVWMMVREALGPRRQRVADEYFAIGVEGLIRAIEGFDPGKSGSLLTYAGMAIKSRVWRELARDTPVTRCGSRPQSADHLALWEQASRAAPLGPGVGDAAQPSSVDSRLQQIDMAALVGRYVAGLKPLERSVLHLLYHVGMPREQAGKQLGGLSKSKVEQIEAGAIRRMRERAAADGGLSELEEHAAD